MRAGPCRAAAAAAVRLLSPHTAESSTDQRRKGFTDSGPGTFHVILSTSLKKILEILRLMEADLLAAGVEAERGGRL